MKQLREIYDGEYVKRTGTGDDPTWRGKMGAIAGVTESIYRFLQEMSDMGDRFIMYNIDQPDRIDAAKRALDNASKMKSYREHMKVCFGEYINYVLEEKEKYEDDIELTNDQKTELLDVSDFATRVRSAVMTDFKSGLVDFVPKVEMPMRMISQLNTLAMAMLVMKRCEPDFKGELELNVEEKKILYKVAFDSIPRTRRDVLMPLARYKGGISTAGLAIEMNLPTPSAKKYLEQINALGICTREKHRGPQGDYWYMIPKWRDIMVKLEGINVIEATLIDQKVRDEDEDAEAAWANAPVTDIDPRDYGRDENGHLL